MYILSYSRLNGPLQHICLLYIILYALVVPWPRVYIITHAASYMHTCGASDPRVTGTDNNREKLTWHINFNTCKDRVAVDVFFSFFFSSFFLPHIFAYIKSHSTGSSLFPLRRSSPVSVIYFLHLSSVAVRAHILRIVAATTTYTYTI